MQRFFYYLFLDMIVLLFPTLNKIFANNYAYRIGGHK